ncbi:MATE family efflux transporter [Sporomusa aerivorans]|uniref:MATE family efflux transporter n=1 Tax=Sporomusa aerivorans TaxID=204936 RepID=UPI00352BB53F
MEHGMFSKKDLRKLIVPLLIEQTLAQTIGMFDTIMVSCAGESAVAGVALVETINVLIINLLTALATGGAIVAGQYLGRGDRKNSSRAGEQLVITTAGVSILIMLICLLLNRQILVTFFGNIEADVMNSARIYFYITSFSYPFIGVYNSVAALFLGMGKTKVVMTNSLIMNVINIMGSAIFIYGLGMGVVGAALSGAISRTVAAIIMIVKLRNPNLAISVRSYSLRNVDFGMIKRILRIGVPNGLEGGIFQVAELS